MLLLLSFYRPPTISAKRHGAPTGVSSYFKKMLTLTNSAKLRVIRKYCKMTNINVLNSNLYDENVFGFLWVFSLAENTNFLLFCLKRKSPTNWHVGTCVFQDSIKWKTYMHGQLGIFFLDDVITLCADCQHTYGITVLPVKG